MTKWTAPDIASIRGDNSRPLQKIFGSLSEHLKDYQNGYTLDSLDDVTITTPTAGQTLSYDAVTSLWKNTSLSGSLSGNASTATNLSTDRTNWSTNGTISAVVGQLAWKNFGNDHTIFDASESTSPNGSAVNNTNAQVPWTGTYPTLMGWNGTFTYGVRVDSARTADIANSVGTLTSLTIDGPGSPSFTLGDTGFTSYSGVQGDKGYLLVGNSISDTTIYLRSSGAGGVYLGASNSNTLQVGNGTVTVVGTMNATTFSGSEIVATTVLAAGRGVGIKADPTNAQSILQFTNNAMSAQWSSIVATNGLLTATTSVAVSGNVTVPNNSNSYFANENGANFWRPTDIYGNSYFRISSGGFYVDAANYYFRTTQASGSAVIMSLASSGAVTINGALNAYSISGNSNVAGTGNASYHPSGIYATNTTNWLYGTLLTNGGNIGAATQYVGAVYSNNWFRSSGTTGWYSETYGGGIYMVDSTWVQTYNGKRFYSSGGFGGSVLYGSYGSMTLYGTNNGYAGISTPDVTSAVMWQNGVYGAIFGHYKNDNAWNFYVINGTFSPSDARYKRDIEPLQHGMNLIREIVPVTFDLLTENSDDDPEQTVGRTHYGFTTQNILQALTNAGETRDVAVVDIGGPDATMGGDRQYLNHSALIAPMVKAIQELDQRLQQLETV
jgi:hypothetical protein